MRYTDGLLPNKVWVQDKTIEEILKYIERMFMFLKYDNDPFISLQVDIPSHPQIFINIEKITDELSYSITHAIHDFLMKPPSYYFNQ